MKRILVRAPNWIGDQIMAYPFFAQLRAMYPQAWIGVVCTEWVKDIQFRGFIDETFVLPKAKKKSIFNSFREIRKIARILEEKGPWDLGIILPNSFGSALLFYLSKVRERWGYQADARGLLLTKKISWNNDPNIHRADAYLRLLDSNRLPPVHAKDFIKKFDPVKHWPAVIPLEIPKDPYVVIAPGATADSRRWDTEKFSDLIQNIHDRWGYKSVIVGGPAEKPLVEEFRLKNLPIIDYVAKGGVSGLWKVFQNAHFTVCNESGLAHVAALCGSRVQIICGAADPKRTTPIGPGKVQVLTNPEVSCWPCEKNVCQFQDVRKNQCHGDIYPSRVMKEIGVGFQQEV